MFRLVLSYWHALDAAVWDRFRTRPTEGNPARITFHIGPHKTGTTTIQALLRTNRRRLRTHIRFQDKDDPDIAAFVAAVSRSCKEQGIARRKKRLRLIAASLASRAQIWPHTLVSVEDLGGRLPTRFGLKELYPLAPDLLKILSQEARAAGLDTQFVFYVREFEAWTESVIRQLKDPGVANLSAKDFRDKHALGQDWSLLITRIEAAIAPSPLHVLSFENDAGPRLGSALLRKIGIPDEVIAKLKWPNPRNVCSRS